MLVNENVKQDLLRLFIWYPFRWMVRALPISFGFFLFRTLGRIHYSMMPGRNEFLAGNYELACAESLKPEEKKSFLLNYFKNHYVDRLQIFLFPRMNKNNINKYHVFKGMDNLEKALSFKKGCILLHAHLGPAQLPLCALGVKEYPVVQIGLPFDEGLSWIGKNVAFRLRQEYEAQIKAPIISAKSFLRPVFDHLKNNGIIMMTGDGAGGNQMIGKFSTFDFLNHRFPFSLGAVTLAHKTGAVVLPLFTRIGPDNIYETIIERPIDIDYKLKKKDEQVFIKEMRVFVKRFERYVLRMPYLWHFWDEYKDRYIPRTEVN